MKLIQRHFSTAPGIARVIARRASVGGVRRPSPMENDESVSVEGGRSTVRDPQQVGNAYRAAATSATVAHSPCKVNNSPANKQTLFPASHNQFIGCLNFLSTLRGQLDHIFRHTPTNQFIWVIFADQLAVGFLDFRIRV